jgi:WD40 repeat protein/cellulose biosynthesis protein BcsQ
MARIVTFYSYKGGTGRSMALANVAWILASNNLRVLIVDWDLEAPGLHRYFTPFLDDGELTHTQGIIDIVREFAFQAVTPSSQIPWSDDETRPASPGKLETANAEPVAISGKAQVLEAHESAWFLPLADVSKYAISIRYPGFVDGCLDFLPAGMQGRDYAERCNTFDWQCFYERLNGHAFLEAFRASMRRDYDFVLIDSRTGVSDTAGICTIQMPDDVVVCFTLNSQSMEGAAAAARSMISKRGTSPDTQVRILPVPMRLDTSEKERLDARMVQVRSSFDQLIQEPPDSRDSYWKDVSVPYWPFYSFQEILAVFGDSPKGANTLLSAYERIASRVTRREIKLYPPSGEEREIVLSAFQRGDRGLINWRRPGVFISYSRIDGADLANRLSRDLQKDGLNVWFDLERLSGGATWSNEIEEAIDGADVLLALLTPGSYASEVCRAEQLRGLRKRKCVIPVLADNRADVPIHFEAAGRYCDFSGTKSYEEEFRRLLADIRSRKGAETKPAYLATVVTAPPLPPNYVERPEVLKSFRIALISGGDSPGVAVTALQGMGGIGKTVLAQALCHDEVVQQAFPDGIAWVTAGKELSSNLVSRMQDVRRVLGDNPSSEETQTECINRYRVLLGQKAALIVVDDIWQAEDIQPFLAESRRSRILFTTRDRSIAVAVGSAELTADLLTEAESRVVLAHWAGVDEGGLPDEAVDLIRECGRLPLALSMVGAMLRGKPPMFWGRVLKVLRTAELDKVSAQFPSYPHRDLRRAFQVSVDELEPAIRERYVQLAVLVDDVPATPPVQQALWGVDEFEALETAERLVNLSLARYGDGGSIRLHDLQLDYVCSQFQDQEALDLVRSAVRLSENAIQRDPAQFAPQIVGRLLPYQDQAGVQRFIQGLVRNNPRPWLRPLHASLHPPGTALLRTVSGHSGSISGVAVTGDGRLAVSASADNTLKVWDLESGRELRTLQGHLSSVTGVAVTPDGRRAVSGSMDHTLKVWDLDTGRELRTLKGHSSSVTGVAVTPDGRRAVSGSMDHTLKVWDLETGRELRTLKGHLSSVTGVAVTPDVRRAVSGSMDHTLKVWDLDTGRELRTLEGHSSSVTNVAVTPDGKRTVSGSMDHMLKVWDLESGRELRTLEGHSSSVTGVAVTPDGRRAVSGSVDCTLKVWDLESGRELLTMEGHSSSVTAVAMMPDGTRAITGSDDQTLKVWDLQSRRAPRTLEAHSGSVRAVAMMPDRKRAVTGSDDHTIKVWDLESGRTLRTLEGHSGSVTSLATTPDGRWVASGSDDHTIKVWDLESGRELRTLEGHAGPVYALALTPDGRRVVSGSDDQTLKVWDLESGRALRTLVGHTGSVCALAVTPDGRWVISGSKDQTLKVWDLETDGALCVLQGHSGSIHAVAVTLDGKRAISASDDRTLRVWDVESGRKLATLEGHSGSVNGVAISPDGRYAASVSADNSTVLWDLSATERLTSFYCDSPAVCCVFGDTRIVVAGDSLGQVHFLALELKA